MKVIVRAQDMLAQGVVEIYKVLAASHNSPLAKGLDKEIERFHTLERSEEDA